MNRGITNKFDLSLILVLGIHMITHFPSEQVCAEEQTHFEFGLSLGVWGTPSWN